MDCSSQFICPVCHSLMVFNEKSYICPNNHLFDKSKYGYVNLLMSNKSSKAHHGDDKKMVLSRTNFLELGYYASLRQLVCDLSEKYAFTNCNVCDIGCGEGYYTSEIYSHIIDKVQKCKFSGIDISKDALAKAGKKNKNIEFAVASAYKLPYLDESQDIIINMFAPFSIPEFNRISSKDSIMIRVFPSEKHLFELKKAIYDNPYENEIDTIEFDGFNVIEKHTLTYEILLKNNDEIKALFNMTPYSYKTSREDIEKLDKLTTLKTNVDFNIIVYKK